jgi:PAS domain S-box-containing protein
LLRISFVLDLSERKQAELERETMLTTVDRMRIVAEQRADELAAIFSTLTEPVIIYAADGDVLRANPAAFELHGLDPRLFIGSGDGAILAPGGDRASRERAPALRALNGETVVNELFTVIDRNGHEVIGHVSAAPLYSKEVLRGAVVAWHDITELERTKTALQQAYDELEKRVLERTTELATANRLLQTEIEERLVAEDELVESREQLRNLSLHLQSVLEREREDIAREIHDELGQSLTAIKLDLSWLHDRYADRSGLLKKIDSMIGLIDMSITSVKRIASELRPAILDHLGLAAAVEWQMKEFRARTGIDCRLVIKPDDLMVDRDRSTALFRILQEALTNVIRHAEASEVRVLLRNADGQITLQILDNGKGITQEQRADHRSFGLMGIRERVLFFNGDIDIHSGEPVEGTSITIRIPLDGAAADS